MADVEDESSRQSANPADDQCGLSIHANDDSEYLGENASEDKLEDNDASNAGIYEIEDRMASEDPDGNFDASRDYGDPNDTAKTADADDAEEGNEPEDREDNADGREMADEDDDDDESDDDVKITIGDITAAPATYTGNFNMKRGPGQNAQSGEKSKFTTEEFEGPMAINGVPAHEFSLDSLEDKPWRKPGADITDYFNYGFNEMTWQAYCDRQRRLRMESGAGIPASLGLGPPPKVYPLPSMAAAPAPIPIAVVNENSKYAGSVAVKKAGPPPARKMAGAIDVIGGGNLSSRRPESGISPPSTNLEEPSEQHPPEVPVEKPPVSAPDFSRPPPGFPNMALPPPFVPPTLPPPIMAMPPPMIVPDPYGPSEFLAGPGAPGDDYYQYEPTQDSQWAPPEWRGGPPLGVPPPMGSMNLPGKGRRESRGTPPVQAMDESRSRRRRTRSRSPKDERDKDKDGDKERKDRDRERERDRDRDRSDRDKRSDRRDRGTSGRDRDRDRERDRDRDRDRDRRRRHRNSKSRSRSRSRSPQHKRSSKRTKRDRSKSKSSSD